VARHWNDHRKSKISNCIYNTTQPDLKQYVCILIHISIYMYTYIFIFTTHINPEVSESI
jgi:hypothetical protein